MKKQVLVTVDRGETRVAMLEVLGTRGQEFRQSLLEELRQLAQEVGRYLAEEGRQDIAGFTVNTGQRGK